MVSADVSVDVSTDVSVNREQTVDLRLFMHVYRGAHVGPAVAQA